MGESCVLIAGLVWRVPCGDEQNLIEAELAGSGSRRLQVSGVDRIESSAEERDVHRLASPMEW